MSHLFISYSRSQYECVDALVSALERTAPDIDVWRDIDDLRAGEQWDARIIAAIRAASLVVLCISPAWSASDACQKEADQARYYHRPIMEIDLSNPVGGKTGDKTSDKTSGKSPSNVETRYDEIAERIAERFREESPLSDVTGNLESRAATWMAHGRPKHELIRGRALRQASRAVKRQNLKITDAAKSYLSYSKARQFTRALFAVIAFLALLAGALAIKVVPDISEQLNDITTSYATITSWYSTIENEVEDDPYTAIQTALDVPQLHEDAENSSFFDYYALLAYQRALEANIPVDVGDANSDTFATFSFPNVSRTSGQSEVMGVNAVLDESGKHISLTHTNSGVTCASVQLQHQCFDLAFSPNGIYLAALSVEGVFIIDPLRGEIISVMSGFPCVEGSVLAWDEESRRIGVSTPTGEAAYWDAFPNVSELSTTGLWFMDGTSLGNGDRAAFLARDGSIAIVNTSSGEVERIEDTLSSPAASHIAAMDENDVYVIAQSEDEITCLYHVDLAVRSTSRVNLPEGFEPTCLAAYAGEESWLVLAGSSNLIYINPDTGEVLRTVEDLTASALQVDDEGRTIAAAYDGFILVVEPGVNEFTGPEWMTVSPGVRQLVIAAGNSRTLTVGNGTPVGDGSKSLVKEEGAWQANAGIISLMTSSQARQSRALASSKDGELFVAGFSDGTFLFIDDATLNPASISGELYGEIRGVAFSSDGSGIVAVTRDGLVARVEFDRSQFDTNALRDELEARLLRAQKLGLA